MKGQMNHPNETDQPSTNHSASLKNTTISINPDKAIMVIATDEPIIMELIAELAKMQNIDDGFSLFVAKSHCGDEPKMSHCGGHCGSVTAGESLRESHGGSANVTVSNHGEIIALSEPYKPIEQFANNCPHTESTLH